MKPRNLLLVPDMIARCNDRNARAKRSIVIFPVMPRPPAVFSPFTMMKSTPYFSFQLRQARDHRAPARFANDIAQKKNR